MTTKTAYSPVNPNRSEPICVVTHPDRFHADDVLACVIVEHAFDQIEIERTDDIRSIRAADVVLDVGGIYDPDRWRFDHHMSPPPALHPEGVPMATAGMAWKEFGHRVIERQCPELDENERCETYEILRKGMILGIDAWDNGIFPKADRIRHANLSQMVGEICSCNRGDEGFRLAMDLFRGSLRVKLRSITLSLLENREAATAWEAGKVTIQSLSGSGVPMVAVIAPEVESISVDWAITKIRSLTGLENAFIAGVVTRCTSGRGGRYWLRSHHPLVAGAEDTAPTLRFLHHSRRFASFDDAEDGLRLLACAWQRQSKGRAEAA